MIEIKKMQPELNENIILLPKKIHDVGFSEIQRGILDNEKMLGFLGKEEAFYVDKQINECQFNINHNANEINNLKIQNENLKNELNKVNGKVVSLENENSSLKNMLNSLEKTVNDLKSELKSVKSDLNSLESKVWNLQS